MQTLNKECHIPYFYTIPMSSLTQALSSNDGILLISVEEERASMYIAMLALSSSTAYYSPITTSRTFFGIVRHKS